MPAQIEDAFELLRLLRMDLSQIQARITDLSATLSSLNLPPSNPSKKPRTGEELQRMNTQVEQATECLGTETFTGKLCPVCERIDQSEMQEAW